MDRCIKITAAGCILLALMLLVMPLRWILAWFLAAAIHEGCHALAVGLCGGTLSGMQIDSIGAQMYIGGLSAARELLCALAGPVGALCLVFAARWFPATAVCAVFQSAYNLLPIYPLDGGRALKCALEMAMPRYAERVCRAVTIGTMTLIWLGAVYAAVGWNLGLMPILLATVISIKLFHRERTGV